MHHFDVKDEVFHFEKKTYISKRRAKIQTCRRQIQLAEFIQLPIALPFKLAIMCRL
jgi:hypothetical protein